MRARHAPTAPPPFPARDEAESGRRGTPRNHVFEGYAGSPASLARPPPGSRTCHVTASSTASATRLVAALLQAPSPPWRERQPLATDLSWPTAPDPPRLGQVVRYLGMPQETGPEGPVCRDTLRRTARPEAMAKPGHRRGRRLLLPSPATRSVAGPPSWKASGGKEPHNRNIVKIFRSRGRPAGEGTRPGAGISRLGITPCAMSPNHAAVRFPRWR